MEMDRETGPRASLGDCDYPACTATTCSGESPVVECRLEKPLQDARRHS